MPYDLVLTCSGPATGSPPPTSSQPVTITATMGPLGNPQSVYFDLDYSAAGFDTVSSTGGYVAPYDARLHAIEVYWDFDWYDTEDAEAYSSPRALTVRPYYYSRKYGRGPFESCVYRGSGSKTVSVMCYEPSSGKIRYGSLTIEITDADTHFAGSGTIALNPTGDSDFSWAPSGAQTVTVSSGGFSDSHSTWISNLNGGANNPSSQPRRYLTKPGATIPFNFAFVSPANIPPDLTIGCADASNKTTVTCPSIVFWNFNSAAASFTWVKFINLTADFGFDPDVDDALSYSADCANWYDGHDNTGVVMHGLEIAGLARQFVNFGGDTSAKVIIHVDETELTHIGGGQYTSLIGVLSHAESYVAYTGCKMIRDTDTPIEAGAEIDGLIRVNGASKLLIKSGEYYQNTNTQQAIKAQENKFSGSTNIHSTKIESAHFSCIRSGRGSGDSVPMNFILDNCILLGGPASRSMLYFEMPGVTVRNNIFIHPDMQFFTTEATGFFEVARSGVSLPAGGAPFHIYNNTFASLRSSAENGGVTTLALYSGPNPWTATFNSNNQFHWPNMTTPDDDGTVDETTILCTSDCGGLNISGSYNTSYAVPAGNYPTFRPNLAAGDSPSLGSASAGRTLSGFPFGVRGADSVEVVTRTTGTTRDRGAWQVSQGTSQETTVGLGTMALTLTGGASTVSNGFSSPEDLFGGTYTEGYWPTDGTTNRYQDEAKSTAASSTSDPVAVVESTGSGPDAVIGSGLTGQRPTINANGLLTHDGSDDKLRVALTTRGSDMLYMAVISSSDLAFYLGCSSASTSYRFGQCFTGDSSTTVDANCGSPTYWVNGAQVSSPTRASLLTAIATGSKVIVEVVGLDLTNANWATMMFTGLNNAADHLSGSQGDFILMENPGTSGRATLRTFLADRHAITL